MLKGAKLLILLAVQVALLTIYDMVKAVDRGMTITDVKLLEKHGGKSGSFMAGASSPRLSGVRDLRNPLHSLRIHRLQRLKPNSRIAKVLHHLGQITGMQLRGFVNRRAQHFFGQRTVKNRCKLS